MIDALGVEVHVGDLLAIGSRIGNHGAMYFAYVEEFISEPTQYPIGNIDFVLLRGMTNNRKRKEEVAVIADRCVVYQTPVRIPVEHNYFQETEETSGIPR